MRAFLDTLFKKSVPPSATATPRVFSRCAGHIVALGEAIPEDDPDAARGPGRGYTFAERPAIVDRLLQAMSDAPHLFDEATVQEMRRRQGRAAGWQALGLTLGDLARRADRYYLRENAALARDALRILRSAREIAAQPGASDTDRERMAALKYPLALVSQWRRRLRGKKKKKK